MPYAEELASASMADRGVLQPAVPVVELVQMPQQNEMYEPEDDWTGRTNAAERRKLQNRLNQRIYRKRRGVIPRKLNPKAQGKESSTDYSAQGLVFTSEQKLMSKFGSLIRIVGLPNDSDAEAVNLSNRSNPEPVALRPFIQAPSSPSHALPNGLRLSDLRKMIVKYEAIAHRDFLLGSPRIDQALTLIQFNVLRALINNTTVLNWSLEWLECTEPISPWNATRNSTTLACPNALRPTLIQRRIEHHPWIDLWPIPKMRDNVLLANDSYDEDQLCNDLVEFHDRTNEQSGLIIWGESWDPKGWEVSETFLKSWGWSVQGCVELLESTNYWRRLRGESPLSSIYNHLWNLA